MAVGAVSNATAENVGADSMAWEAAKQQGTNRALTSFLIAHPTSKFSEDARQMLIAGKPVVNLPDVQSEGTVDGLYTDLFQNV